MAAAFHHDLPAAAVVIVNHFKAKRLLDGIGSLHRQTIAKTLSVAVVENSMDECERRVLSVDAPEGAFLLVEPGGNIGYTRGCNLGVAALPYSRYVVLCNPDVVWDQPNALERLIAMADADPSIGVLAPLQFSDDGSPVEIARTFPTLAEQVKRRLNPRSGSELYLNNSLAEGLAISTDVDWVQSSCVLVRRTLWDRIGGLDERYFLFMSDVELGRATWSAGLRVCLTSAATVRADGKRASKGGFGALLTSRAQRDHLVDAIKYYLVNGARKLRRPQISGLAYRRVTSTPNAIGATSLGPRSTVKSLDAAVHPVDAPSVARRPFLSSSR